MHKYILITAGMSLLIAGCGLNLSTPIATVPSIITSTLPPTVPPALTETTQPPAAVSTPTPIEGTTTTQLNVRGEPSTASAPLGMIGPSVKVQITGKDPNGKWYQIVYAQGPDGKGWVTAQYVDVKDQNAIPVLGAATGSGSGPSGLIIQQVNVRSGPATTFNALGTLNANDVVTLTGKDPNGVWLQIEYANGPEGKGWVTAAYVQASGLEGLPIIGQAGDVVGTGTPTTIPATITPTLVPAMQDGDSQKSPAVDIVFSPTGTRSLIYSSDLSAPQGDAEDWIRFTPYTARVIVTLSCAGKGKLKVELLENSAPQTPGSIDCRQTALLSLAPGQPDLIKLSMLPAGAGLQYVRYTLSVETVH